MAGHLLKPGSVFAFLAEHRRVLFPDALFEDLFNRTAGLNLRRLLALGLTRNAGAWVLT